jgi:hypothetical protein
MVKKEKDRNCQQYTQSKNKSHLISGFNYAKAIDKLDSKNKSYAKYNITKTKNTVGFILIAISF